ncbi:hypothetical protein AXX17_AT4G09940 [Arabidopsis thaliana]|uniref:RRM domain-containing protein n=1 Tax=Arabidopsis thaliana TaxID=3702 RepID=A0A178V161_ARATH|nr:hypothetical protein AXX17_AT4G09940 [Arabidopsis thaliana]
MTSWSLSKDKVTLKKDEATPAVIKPTKPLKEGKREPEDDLETKVNLKKQKKNFENKETMEGYTSFLQMIEAKVDSLTSKVDLLVSVKGVSETKNLDAADKNGSLTAKAESIASKDESKDNSHDEKKLDLPTSISYSADKDSNEVVTERGSFQTIYVEGFGSSFSEDDDIKSALSKHFSVCGEITRVFVPRNPSTGAIKGFAYIDLKEGAKKALELSGSKMTGKELVVKTVPLPMRDSNPGYSGRYPGFGGRFRGRFGFVGGIFGGGRCGGYGRCGRC